MTLAHLLLFFAATFFASVLACCFALGRMHRWLKDKGEGFGNGATLNRSIESNSVQATIWTKHQK